jgi:hypothetical protein
MRSLTVAWRGGGAAGVRTPRELLATVGRLALWLTVGVLLIRGLGATFDGRHGPREPHARVVRATVWPDDAARALAVEFATANLTHTAGEDPDAVARRLDELVAPDVQGELMPHFDTDAPAQAVRTATIARTITIDRRRALITVAATLVTDGQLGARRLTVPVARDAAGGLVVDDLPSFTAAPARAASEPTDAGPLIGLDSRAITDVLTRFLRSYLAGDSGALAYLTVPGARIAAASGRLELLSLGPVTTTGGEGRDGGLVLVTVHARDLGSRALYMLRYRVALVRRDRWYVAELNEEGAGR